MTPRTSKDPNKIKDVELVRGRWIYRPFVPKSRRSYVRHDRRGRLAPPIKLGVEADPWHRIVSAHARAFAIFSDDAEREKFTIRWLEAEYQESSKFKSLAKGTQAKAKTNRRVLDHPIRIEGRDATLADLRVEELDHPTLYRIREKRLTALQDAGRDGRSQCNRELAYLSAVVTWARKLHKQVSTNPFRGLEALPENVSDRYVTHEEYWAQYDIAHEVADYLPVVFEMLYLLAQRGIEATDILLTDIQDKVIEDGTTARVIRIRRRKGSQTTDIMITPRHQAFIDACMVLHRKRPVSGVYLLPGMRGERMKKGTIDSAMQDLKRLMGERGLMTRVTRTESQDAVESPLFWNLHLLKAKGITDAKNKAIGGHKSRSMQERYTRAIDTFDSAVQPARKQVSATVTKIRRTHK